MRTFVEQSSESRILNSKCKHLATGLFGAIKSDEQFVKIPATVNVATDPAAKGKVLLLKEGYLTYSLHGKKVFFYEQGDIVGLDYLYGGASAEISSSFATSVDVFHVDRLLSVLQAKPDLLRTWNELLIHQFNFAMSCLATVTTDQLHFSPDERVVEAGTVIVEQGSLGYEIFSLVTGHCDVIVDNVKVGEILEDELFGVLAAVSQSPRTASVVATKQSRVLSLHIDNFIDLIRYRPSTALKMVNSFSRAISSLNEQVVRSGLNQAENLRGG